MSLDKIYQIPNFFEGFLFTRLKVSYSHALEASLLEVVPLVCWDRLDLPKPNCKSCFLRKDRPNEGGAKGSLEAKVGDGMAEFQSSEIMIDEFLEMLMGKIQEVLICRLIMIDLDMGKGKDLYFFVCFFFAGTIQCHNGALRGLRGTREMHRSDLPKGVSSPPVSHIFTMFTSESSLLDESLAETSD